MNLFLSTSSGWLNNIIDLIVLLKEKKNRQVGNLSYVFKVDIEFYYLLFLLLGQHDGLPRRHHLA